MTHFLIVGGGSMGKRRIRCLLANGVEPTNIRLAEVREDRRQKVRQDYCVDSFTDFDEGMQWGCDAVIVSVPGALHMKFCLAAASAGKHVFCEVPLSTSLEGTEELIGLVDQHNLMIAPGCQVLFDPVAKQVKTWLNDPAFGQPLIYHEMFGAYLPDWHPYEDYRSFYASDQKMGGGNLDVIAQELTAAHWMTGRMPEHVFAQGNHLSSLQIDGHDCQQIIARTDQQMAWTLQFDLIQRPGGGSRKIVSEAGTIEVEHHQARRYLAERGEWETYQRPGDFEHEQPYRDEIAQFLRCVEGEATWPISLKTAIDVVRFLLAMQQSIAVGQMVEI